MKTGICIGGFCPLHRGHLDAIMCAKKENDRCVVIVYGYDNEPRTLELGLTTQDRFYAIRDYFRGTPWLPKEEQIVVKMLHYHQKQQDWTQLLYDALELAKCEKEDAIFYTIERTYYDYAIAKGFSCILKEPLRAISASMIRKNPIKYWDYMADILVFKRALNTSILLSGASCEGKTTCACDLAKYFSAAFVEEASKRLAKHEKINLKGVDKNTISYFITSQYVDNSAYKYAKITFADGDTVSNLAYAKLLLSEKEYLELKDETLFRRRLDFKKVFLFTPHSTFIDDGYRTMAKLPEIRKITFETMCSLYDELGYDCELIDGDYWSNFCKIRDYVLNI